MPHAWIFHGPLGVGKFTTAVEFARLLLDPQTLAQDVDRFEAPRRGADAALFEAGTHPDLHIIRREMAAASRIAALRRRKLTSIPLDLVREQIIGGRVEEVVLDAPVARSSVRGRGKVFIIDEAELLEAAAQDALLKTLEEPVPSTWIILVTTREHVMRPTVRSRCQRAAFTPLDPASMQRWACGSRELPSGQERLWLLGAEEQAGSALAGAQETPGFAEGSPGIALFALRHGLCAWPDVLAPFVEDALRGRARSSAGEAMFKLVDELAKALVKERSDGLRRLGAVVEEPDVAEEGEGEEGAAELSAGAAPKGEASLAAAKRDAAEWLLAVLAHETRRRTLRAVREGRDPSAALRLLDLLPQAARQLDDNVNLRSVLGDLAALAAAARPATIPFVGVAE